MAGRENEIEGEVRRTTLALLARRAADATVCPSEVARAIGAKAGTLDWRAAMPEVHATIDGMVADGLVRLSWKGEAMQLRDGPYRIALSRFPRERERGRTAEFGCA